MNYNQLTGRNRTQEIIPGETKRWFWASLEDILTLPSVAKLSDTITSFSELVDILDDIIFKSGTPTKGWVSIYQTRDSGNFKFESKGERDMAGMGGEMNSKYPGSDSEALGMARQLRSDTGLVLRELANGDLILAGSRAFPVEAKIGFMSGQNESGYLGMELKFDYFNPWIVKYKGAVTMSATGGTF